MVQEVGTCLGFVAPYYNLILVLIVLSLFIKLLSMPKKKVYRTPWEFLFSAILIYVVEEIVTVIDMAGIASIPPFVFPLFETIIVSMFIYMLFLQKEHIDTL